MLKEFRRKKKKKNPNFYAFSSSQGKLTGRFEDMCRTVRSVQDDTALISRSLWCGCFDTGNRSLFTVFAAKILWLIFDFYLFGTRHSKGKCHTVIRGFDSQYFKEIFVVEDFCRAVSAVWAHSENLMVWVWWCVTHRGLTDLTAVDTAVFGAYITQCKTECSHSISRNWGENESLIVFVEGIDSHCNMETRK